MAMHPQEPSRRSQVMLSGVGTVYDVVFGKNMRGKLEIVPEQGGKGKIPSGKTCHKIVLTSVLITYRYMVKAV